MFGRKLDEHDRRYDLAEEWTEILLRLWTEEEEFDHEGEFFRIERGYSAPKPLQRPHPPIMNAAGSVRGMEYAARMSDLVFVKLDDVPERAVEQVAGVKERARALGREIEVWTFGYVVCADTEQEARDFVHHYAVEHGEHEASHTALRVMGVEARMRSDSESEAFRLSWVASATAATPWSAPPPRSPTSWSTWPRSASTAASSAGPSGRTACPASRPTSSPSSSPAASAPQRAPPPPSAVDLR